MEDATTLEIRVRPCTTAAAVSSQVDSMPSTIGSLNAAPFAALLTVPFGCSVLLFRCCEADDPRLKFKAHGVRVDAFGLVVAFTQAHSGKTEPFVQC